jgi:hypothetical protein
MNSSVSEKDVRRRRSLWVTASIILTLVMGPGPGILLVNTADPVWGFPAIYLWGLFWYAVELVTVVYAFVFVWDQSDD